MVFAGRLWGVIGAGMWCGRKVHALVITTGVCASLFCQRAGAALEIVQQNVTLEKLGHEFGFTNPPPDLTAIDSLGRQMDSFKYEIASNPKRQFSEQPYPNAMGATSGEFSFGVMSSHLSAQSSEIQGVTVPLPPALPSGLCILGGIALAGMLRRRRLTN